jgi:uncharacterized protein YigA (DUF484 family)
MNQGEMREMDDLAEAEHLVRVKLKKARDRIAKLEDENERLKSAHERLVILNNDKAIKLAQRDDLLDEIYRIKKQVTEEIDHDPAWLWIPERKEGGDG